MQTAFYRNVKSLLEQYFKSFRMIFIGFQDDFLRLSEELLQPIRIMIAAYDLK